MKKTIITAGLLLLPTAAMAHPSLYHHTHSFTAGLVHPLTGLDHLLAMVSVGLWASQKGGRALWLWPAAFVGAMVVGGILGMEGVALPLIEPAIAASLLVLGLMIAAMVRLPLVAGIGLIAAFGLFHGNAHGLEAPASGASLLYGLGFVVSTAALHALGLAIGLSMRSVRLQPLLRAGAALIALAGGVLFFA